MGRDENVAIDILRCADNGGATGVNWEPRNLAGKPSAGICATPSRRIPLLYGPVVHVRRCNTHRFIDNRR